MNKKQQIEFIQAFILLWDASDVNDNSGLLDHLQKLWYQFCDEESLECLPAEELLEQLQKNWEC